MLLFFGASCECVESLAVFPESSVSLLGHGYYITKRFSVNICGKNIVRFKSAQAVDRHVHNVIVVRDTYRYISLKSVY